jgi:hypothetical protein
MSKGNDSRTDRNRQAPDRAGKAGVSRSSRSSVPMTAERARAIQAHADQHEKNQDFKARAMAAADRNEAE